MLRPPVDNKLISVMSFLLGLDPASSSIEAMEELAERELAAHKKTKHTSK